MPVSTILGLWPHFPPQIVPCRLEHYPNSYCWHHCEKEQEGRMEWKGQTGKHSPWKGERVGEDLSGWSQKHGWEAGQDSFGKYSLNMWLVSKRQQVYLIARHPTGTAFHVCCLILWHSWVTPPLCCHLAEFINAATFCIVLVLQAC